MVCAAKGYKCIIVMPQVHPLSYLVITPRVSNSGYKCIIVMPQVRYLVITPRVSNSGYKCIIVIRRCIPLVT